MRLPIFEQDYKRFNYVYPLY